MQSDPLFASQPQYRIMKQAITFLRADHGPALRQAVGALAVLVALTHTLGYLTGAWVHQLNDRLAHGPRDIPTISAPVLIQRPEQPATMPRRTAEGFLSAVTMAQSAAPQPPTLAAPPLAGLTVAELRQLARAAGHRKLARSGRRAQLLQVLA
jgi:hypothetical protein